MSEQPTCLRPLDGRIRIDLPAAAEEPDGEPSSLETLRRLLRGKAHVRLEASGERVVLLYNTEHVSQADLMLRLKRWWPGLPAGGHELFSPRLRQTARPWRRRGGRRPRPVRSLRSADDIDRTGRPVVPNGPCPASREPTPDAAIPTGSGEPTPV